MMEKVAVITGGNGSVGMGIAKRLLIEHSIQVYLVCRNITKGLEARDQLLLELREQVEPEAIKVVQCDLSNPKSVFKCCHELNQLHRIDYLVLNAGVMPTDGIDLYTGVKNLFTRPAYVAKTGGDIIKQRQGETTAEGLGYVFAANGFGHFIMVRELTDLMQKSGNSALFWCSSTTACPELFNPDDYQCKEGSHPYESSKRLTELISMVLNKQLNPKGIYSFLTSPGNVMSGITQGTIHPLLLLFALYVMRLFGCSGINITGENAATATLDLLDCEFDQMDPYVLYHSEMNLFGTKSTRIIHIDKSKGELDIGRRIMNQMDQLYQSFKH